MTAWGVTNAHVVPCNGPAFDGAVLVREERIEALGSRLEIPSEADIVDAQGAWLLPGFIDAHVHLGLHEQDEGRAGDDSNEMTDPVMAGARAIDAVNPFDSGFHDALSGGVTCVNVMPGSANPVGGLTAALRTSGRRVDDMTLRHPTGLKAALGENPKQVWGDKNELPSTRLGTALVLRQALADAQDYLRQQPPFRRDLKLEALAMVLEGDIPLRLHAHRADDIATGLRVADEFGIRLVLDHGTEALILVDLLAERDIPVMVGPLFTARHKVELRNKSMSLAADLAAAGLRISLVTDHPLVPIQLLVHQAALAVREGLDRAEAFRALTLNPATALGIHEQVGSLAPGKAADMVLWSGDPLDMMQRALRVWIGGRTVYRHGTESI